MPQPWGWAPDPEHPPIVVVEDAKLSDACNYEAVVTIAGLSGAIVRAASEKVMPLGTAEYWKARGFSSSEIESGMKPWLAEARAGAAKLVSAAERNLEVARAEADAIRRGTFVPV